MAGVPTVAREFFGLNRPGGKLPSREVQELWFATRRRPWISLCVVPAAPGMSVVPLAETLASVGQLLTPTGIRLIKAEGMNLEQIARIVMEMTLPETPASSVWTSTPQRGGHAVSAAPNGTPLIIAIESVVSNPLALAVTLACDVVLLCIELGKTDLASARHSVDLLGREHIVGTVLIEPGRR